MISVINVLNALSDDKAFVLYNTVALGKGRDFDTIIKNMGITPHQYYSRILKITQAGLVKRENGECVTTALGDIVYEAVSIIGKALNHFWVLKAIEAFKSSDSIESNENISKIIDSLIDDPRIKKILNGPPILSTS